jgi:hypothetical protein
MNRREFFKVPKTDNIKYLKSSYTKPKINLNAKIHDKPLKESDIQKRIRIYKADENIIQQYSDNEIKKALHNIVSDLHCKKPITNKEFTESLLLRTNDINDINLSDKERTKQRNKQRLLKPVFIKPLTCIEVSKRINIYETNEHILIKQLEDTE